MRSKRAGLPLAPNPEHASRLYDGTEYKDFWVGKEKANLDDLEHALVRELLPETGRRIIDIGCGFGRLADCYLDRFEQVVMLDGSITLLQQAQDTFKDKAVYIAADANHLPLAKSSFDCALMIRVFHHLSDAQWILSELRRILGHGGVFLFNYSNKLSARQLFRRLLRWNAESPFVLAPVMAGKMLTQHHPAYIHQILTKTGFSEMKYFGTGVADKLAGRLGRFETWIPSGKTLASLLGIIKLAPWIMCRTRSSGEVLKDYKCIDDLLICPSCHSTVRHSAQSYVCISCNLSYPIENGIADFRVDA
jgi:ubiquinone/menaquinone biosynthesis C-methylase UbiE